MVRFSTKPPAPPQPPVQSSPQSPRQDRPADSRSLTANQQPPSGRCLTSPHIPRQSCPQARSYLLPLKLSPSYHSPIHNNNNPFASRGSQNNQSGQVQQASSGTALKTMPTGPSSGKLNALHVVPTSLRP